MQDINFIKKRISNNSSNKILKILTIVFSLLLVLISGLIYVKKDENASFLKENFNIDADFSSFNLKMDNLVNSLFSFMVTKDDQLVSENVVYLKGDSENYYYCETAQIKALDDGIIYFVEENDDNSYSILVDYGNNLLAAYYQVFDPLVKTYDQVKKGDYFCSYNNEFKVLFRQDGKIVDYFE